MFRKSHLTAFACAITLTSPLAFASPHPIDTHELDDEIAREEARTEARNEFHETRKDTRGIPGDLSLRPHDESTQNQSNAVERANDRVGALADGPITGGVESKSYKDYKQPAETCEWFCNPSVFTDYSYINIDDHRKYGSDGYTNSWSGGFDFTTKGNILLGALYSFSRDSLGSALLHAETHTDTHFISLYAAKNFWKFLNIGVSGGYGHTEVESVLHSFDGFKGRDSASDVDTWSVSPFIGISKRFGALSTSFTTTYLFSSSETDAPNRSSTTQTGKLAFDFKLGYAVTEKLTIFGTARFIKVVDYEEASPDFPEDRSWATFGTKITYRVTEPFEIFGAYAYDAFNTSYDNHTGRVGMSYSF